MIQKNILAAVLINNDPSDQMKGDSCELYRKIFGNGENPQYGKSKIKQSWDSAKVLDNARSTVQVLDNIQDTAKVWIILTYCQNLNKDVFLPK